MAILSMAMMIVGSYLATQRDDSQLIQNQLNDHSRRIAVLETRVEYLELERANARDRD